jgi:hypothetical protein
VNEDVLAYSPYGANLTYGVLTGCCLSEAVTIFTHEDFEWPSVIDIRFVVPNCLCAEHTVHTGDPRQI